MNAPRFFTAVLLLASFISAAGAQNTTSSADAAHRDLDAIGAAIQPMPQDAEISRALARISAAQIQDAISTLVSFRNRSTLSVLEKDLPPGTGIVAAADWIESQFKQISAACGGCLEVHRDSFIQPPLPGPISGVTQPTPVTDVYAVMRGADPSQAARMILVTGHYDSRDNNGVTIHGGPGANDDASGTAVSLECARVLSKVKLPATLVFVAVAGEEQGLLGSKHLAEEAKQDNWQLEGALNNDIVGGNHTPGDRFQDEHAVRVFSESVPLNASTEEMHRYLALGYEGDSPSRELARAIVDVARTYTGAPIPYSDKPNRAGLEPVLEFRRDRFDRGGDHSSFNRQGFAAVRFSEWREDFNHQHQNVRVEDGVQYGDLLKYDNFNYIARVARLNAATMAVLSAAPPPPVTVQYPPPRSVLTSYTNALNNTQIEWDAAPGTPAGTDYEILWRPTAGPDWTRSIPANRLARIPDGRFSSSGGHYSVQIPVSRDNVVFGVRAVDAKGHRSPAAVPWPAPRPER